MSYVDGYRKELIVKIEYLIHCFDEAIEKAKRVNNNEFQVRLSDAEGFIELLTQARNKIERDGK